MSVSGNIASIYKNFSKFPLLSSAKFLLKNSNHIGSLWVINDLVSSKSKVVNINFQIDDNCQLIYKSPSTLRDEEVLIDVISQNCKYRATCLERKNAESLSKDGKINSIFIWSDELLLKTINLTDLDTHGPVYKAKKLSHFQSMSKENSSSSSSKSVEIGNQYLRRAGEFGEQLDQVREPVVCVLDVQEERIEVLDSKTLCPEHTIGAISASPTGGGFAFTAYRNMAFELGVIYCTQRPCDLFYYDWESKTVTKIGDENKSKMSPKMSPDGLSLVWLENDVGGPHFQGQRLMRYDFLSHQTQTVVDLVRSPGCEFPGLYCMGLINNCFTSDGKYIFVNSKVRCRSKILLIHLESGNVKILEQLNFRDGSESILDTNHGYVLVSVSSPSLVAHLAIDDIKSILDKGQLNLSPVSSIHNWDNILRYEIIDHEPTVAHPKFGKINFQSIFIEAKKEEPCPLILILHGGPHGGISTEYATFLAATAELGYHSLIVNYRGSFGFGEDFLHSLLGYIGEMDVSDCIKACEDVLTLFASKIDNEKIFLYGGSHGGFLGAHLAAKYSNKVKAVAIRNPVINLLSMLSSTDIPDWIYTESGYSWDYNYLLTNEKIVSIWDKSPLKFVDQIKCPILLMIGQEDKRVPTSQSIEFYRVLRARSVETNLHIYPKDCHPLSSVEASSDCFVNTLMWFDNNRK